MKLAVDLLLGALFCFAGTSMALGAGDPARWVPARWDGGPLEVARRADDKSLGDTGRREAVASWYNPATLKLLEGTPVNCLLLTLSAPAAAGVERQQQALVKAYAALARERGMAVLGIVYPGGEPASIAAAAADARLDGLVLDGKFPAGFADKLEAALKAKSGAALVIPISREAPSARISKAPLLAIEGTQPAARNLADEGVRAAASSEPCLESNIWLARSFRLGSNWRPLWINQQPASATAGDYVRYVADAAAAGGRWMVAVDDNLRAQLYRNDAAGLATWQRMATYLRFAEEHADWRSFVPYGNLAIVVDPASKDADFQDEYLNLIARRQVPYRILQRSQLTRESLAGVPAVVAAGLAPATPAERKLLNDFAEQGGVVIAGAWWGPVPKNDSYDDTSTEIHLGKGRVVVYKDELADPQAVSKDMKDLLEPQAIGFSVFNVPSAITYVSTSDSGHRVLVQMVDYSDRPYGRVTMRFNGIFKTARLYTPDDPPAVLEIRPAAHGRTEVFISKPLTWGAVILE